MTNTNPAQGKWRWAVVVTEGTRRRTANAPITTKLRIRPKTKGGQVGRCSQNARAANAKLTAANTPPTTDNDPVFLPNRSTAEPARKSSNSAQSTAAMQNSETNGTRKTTNRKPN